MDNPSCSILIVNYNGGQLFVDCVYAALSSSMSVEVLVWDNASQDGSIAKLETVFAGDSRLTVFRHPSNLGFAAGVNQLIPKASGQWLLLLNPDCLLAFNTIAEMIAVLEDDPKVGMGGCLVCNPDGSEQIGCRRRVPTPWRSMVHIFCLDYFFRNHPRCQNISLHRQPLPDLPAEVEAISGSFMFVRRIALDDVGLLDAGYFMHCEDLDWCQRFRDKGWRILFVPKTVVVHVKAVCSRDRPFFVEWHKHKGMILFYRKFFQHQYPALFMWIVFAGILCNFAMRVGRIMLQRLCRKCW